MSASNRCPFAVLLLAVLFSAFVVPAHADVFCVGTEQELSDAFAAAGENGLADEVRLRAGTFFSDVQPLASGFTLSVLDGRGVVISGGWNADCSSERLDPTLTAIDGNYAMRVMTIAATLSSQEPVAVRWLTLRHGVGQRGYALWIAATNYQVPVFIVENCIVRDNRNWDGYWSLGAVVLEGDGVFVLRNSLFVGNRGSAGSALFLAAAMHDGDIYPAIVNNTFVNNETMDDNALTIYSAGGPMTFENNIVWNSIHGSATANDFMGFTASVLRNNDIERVDLVSGGGPGPESGGNLAVDPGFVGPDNFRLRADSPLRGQGWGMPYGGFGDVDLDGAPRVEGGGVDMGAYESDRLFTDGFEG